MNRFFYPAVRLALAAFLLTATVSCLPTGSRYATAGNTVMTNGTVIDGASAPGARVYQAPLLSTGLFFGSGGYYNRGYGSGYGGYGYGSRARCNVCGYNPCRCGGGSHGSSGYYSQSGSGDHDHESDHPHAHDTYAVAGGSLRSTQTKPTGYHSLDWYKSKGYDTSDLKLVNEHGEPKGSSGSSSSSKPKSSGSSSSKSSGGSSKEKSSSSSGQGAKNRGR